MRSNLPKKTTKLVNNGVKNKITDRKLKMAIIGEINKQTMKYI